MHAQCKQRHVSKSELILSTSKRKLELHHEGQTHWIVNLFKCNLTPSQVSQAEDDSLVAGCGSGMWMTHEASLAKVMWMGSYIT